MHNSIKSPAIFKLIKSENKRVFLKSIIIYYSNSLKLENTSFAIKVSRKYGNAVLRNRFKRLVRAAVNNLKIRFSHPFIVIPKKCQHDLGCILLDLETFLTNAK